MAIPTGVIFTPLNHATSVAKFSPVKAHLNWIGDISDLRAISYSITGDLPWAGGVQVGSLLELTRAVNSNALLSNHLYTWSCFLHWESYNSQGELLSYGDIGINGINLTFTTAYYFFKVTTPTPVDASGPGIDFSGFTLSWVNGGGATKYDVWVGPVGNLVKVSTHQTGTSYVTNLSEVPYNQVIYWRVDAFDNAENSATGDVWHFDARPTKVTCVLPTNGGSGLRLYPTYTWNAAAGATTYTLGVTI